MIREEILHIAKPILFNTDMVRAILDDRKTETRRLLKLPRYIKQQENGLYTLYAEGTCYENQHLEGIVKYIKPPYKAGDYLYVRETWSELSFGYVYKAHGDKIDHLGNLIRWRPSIHMPKEAARIFLGVTDIRVERLQDIMKDPPGPHNAVVKEGCKYGCDFIAVWENTIPKEALDKYGWDANPWVWVIEFERVEV